MNIFLALVSGGHMASTPEESAHGFSGASDVSFSESTVGPDECDASVLAYLPADSDEVFEPQLVGSDTDRLTATAHAGGRFADAPAMLDLPPVLTLPGQIEPYVPSPKIENCSENPYACQIGGYQDTLAEIFWLSAQLSDHPVHQDLDNPASLINSLSQGIPVTGVVDDETVQWIKCFQYYFAPDISAMTLWGTEGFSRGVVAAMQTTVAYLRIQAAQQNQADHAIGNILDRPEIHASEQAQPLATDFRSFVTGAQDLDYLGDEADNQSDVLESAVVAEPGYEYAFETCGLDMVAIQRDYEGTPYGTGRGQYDCVTFVNHVLTEAGYDLDRGQVLCFVSGDLGRAVFNDVPNTQGAPGALIDSGAGVAVDVTKPMPAGTVIQYWYYDSHGNLRGHAGIVAKSYDDGSVDLYGAHASSGKVTTRRVRLNANHVAKVYAALPLEDGKKSLSFS